MTIVKEIRLAGVDLNLLVVLEAVLEEKNVTRAAIRLNKSQPSVSNGLSRLRHLFNDPLLEREGNGMRLTLAAHALKPRVKEALDQVRGLLARGDAFDPRAGTHRIRACSAENVSLYFAPALERRLRACGVDAELTIFWPNNKEDALKRLSRGRVDLLLGAYLETCDDAERYYLYEEPAVCLVRQSHPALGRLAGGDVIEAEALADYPLVNAAYRGAAGRQFEAALGRWDLSVTPIRSIHQLTMTPYTMLGDNTVALTTRRMALWLASLLPLRALTPGFELPVFPIEMLVQKARIQEGWMQWLIGQILQAVPHDFGERPDVITPADELL